MTELPINQIIQGDCLEVMRGWPDGCVDAVITDPPYGIDLQPQRGRTEAIVNDRPDEARELWGAVIPECFRVLKDNTASLFFGRWSEVWAKELLDKYFTVKGCIVWKKNVWGIGYYLRPQWELAWYIHKGKPPVPDAAISDVWEFDREPAPIHSCQKPLHLLTHAVNFCGGDIILDPFAGSGTTLVAAKQLGRKYIGIEIEPKYVAICKERLKQEQLAL